MASKALVAGEIDTTQETEGIMVLTVTFGPELMLARGTSQRLGSELVDQYNALSENSSKTRSCVIDIQATTGGSPLDRALFDLYRIVEAEGGQVIVSGYPAD